MAREEADRRGSERLSEPRACVYIVECADGTLYTGWSNDVEARVAAHNTGKAARYTAGRRPVTLIYTENCGTKSAAMKKERQIKGYSRARKLALSGSLKI
ncbi:MAG: GIY-YIG nuclease family protein [Synergistaceae bacterium]|jgi:putative endonuclease|nr:GIY-YIG nuclease family protein [Synergistaceae bacterium]